MGFHKFITGLGAICLAACSTSTDLTDDLVEGLAGPTPPAANETLNQRINDRLARREGQFPNLSDIPSTRPERLRVSEIAALESALERARDELTTSVDQDLARAREERDGTAASAALPIDAEALRSQSARDQALAKQQAAKKMPELGGLPPKNQR